MFLGVVPVRRDSMNYIKITDRYGNCYYFRNCQEAAAAYKISKITVWKHLREQTTDRRGRKFELIRG